MQSMVEAFRHIPALYIADGHHRSAAASRVRAARRESHPATAPHPTDGGWQTALRFRARGVVRFSGELPLLGLAGSTAMASAADEAGLRFVPEAFADRRYQPDGRLRSRREPDALITDPGEAARQAVRVATEGFAVAADGSAVRVEASSLGVHGVTPRWAEIQPPSPSRDRPGSPWESDPGRSGAASTPSASRCRC
jgi:hypothetical protein